MTNSVRLLAPLALAVCLGCGGGNDAYKTVAVSGVLTCQGNPVPGVQVIFSPQPGEGRSEAMPGKSAGGLTDAEGKFTLSTYEVNDGAIVGKHTVTIIVPDDPENPVPEEVKKTVAPCLGETMEVEVKPGMEEVALKLGE